MAKQPTLGQRVCFMSVRARMRWTWLCLRLGFTVFGAYRPFFALDSAISTAKYWSSSLCQLLPNTLLNSIQTRCPCGPVGLQAGSLNSSGNQPDKSHILYDCGAILFCRQRLN